MGHDIQAPRLLWAAVATRQVPDCICVAAGPWEGSVGERRWPGRGRSWQGAITVGLRSHVAGPPLPLLSWVCRRPSHTAQGGPGKASEPVVRVTEWRAGPVPGRPQKPACSPPRPSPPCPHPRQCHIQLDGRSLSCKIRSHSCSSLVSPSQRLGGPGQVSTAVVGSLEASPWLPHLSPMARCLL